MLQPLLLQLLLLLLMMLLQVLLPRRPVLLLLQMLLLMLLLRFALLAQTAENVSTLSAAQSRRKMGDLTLAIRTPSAMHAGLFAKHSVATWTLHGDKEKNEVGSLELGNWGKVLGGVLGKGSSGPKRIWGTKYLNPKSGLINLF